MKRSGIVILGMALLAIVACTSPPYPEDQSLLDRFQQNRNVFETLKNEPHNKELMGLLHVEKVVVSSLDPTETYFITWSQDLAGPGGCAKGYAYLDKPPTSTVSSIDSEVTPCGPEQVTLFQHIEGPWYLYYRAVN